MLTTRPLPDGTPEHVVSAPTPEKLLELMRDADFDGDVHLVGGQRTVDAFRGIGALDNFGVVLLPILLGDGMRLTPAGSVPQHLRLESSRTLEDGSVKHIYTLAAAIADR